MAYCAGMNYKSIEFVSTAVGINNVIATISLLLLIIIPITLSLKLRKGFKRAESLS